MQIALLSDIHDNILDLAWALDHITNSDAQQVFCMGDIVSPYATEKIAQLSIPVFSVFGNNDGDKAQIMRIALNTDNLLTFAQRDFGEIEIESKKYFLTHYPELAEHAALSGRYSAVFHGHTHEMRNEMIKDTPIINPGKLATYPNDTISIAYFDTDTQQAFFIIKDAK